MGCSLIERKSLSLRKAIAKDSRSWTRLPCVRELTAGRMLRSFLHLAVLCYIQVLAIISVIVASVLILAYVWIRFKDVRFGIGSIAASMWGKFKTTFQMIMICMIILNFDCKYYQYLVTVITWIAFILTIISLVDYIIKNIDVLKNDNH